MLDKAIIMECCTDEQCNRKAKAAYNGDIVPMYAAFKM